MAVVDVRNVGMCVGECKMPVGVLVTSGTVSVGVLMVPVVVDVLVVVFDRSVRVLVKMAAPGDKGDAAEGNQHGDELR